MTYICIGKKSYIGLMYQVNGSSDSSAAVQVLEEREIFTSDSW